MDNGRVREVILVAYDYSYKQAEWVHPFEQCINGISADQAAWRPGPDLMGIWDIVLHVALHNEKMTARIVDGKNPELTEGDWPALPTKLTEENWEAAKDRCRLSMRLLGETIRTAPFEKLVNSPYGLPDLLCRLTHHGYHLGQIEKIRECQGWLEGLE